MQFEVSDLLFPGFTKDAMKRLDKQYGIEFFYEFGKDYYWKVDCKCKLNKIYQATISVEYTLSRKVSNSSSGL